MIGSTKKQISTLVIFFCFVLIALSQSHVGAVDETVPDEPEQTRIILTFESHADKEEFLETLPQAIAEQTSARSISQRASDEQTTTQVDESNVVQDDFGKLPIITLDVTPLEQETLTELLPGDVEIAPVGIRQLFLSTSVPLINATRVWPIQQTRYPSLEVRNLTGIGQSACVIDTGINADHVDFAGKFIVQKCFCAAQPGNRAADCCPNGQSTDTNASDSNGHGTHVAGIIAANGVVKGVAPNASIVAVKVFGSDDVAYDDDILQAIQYCTANAQTYNITVISMSLGGGLYASACPSDTLEPAITAAIAQNISVVVATGNDAYVNAIASPACVPGVTRVAASNNTDGIAESFSNTNSLVSLVAPGVDIISTYNTGGYAQLDGTSMATPHVSGAILLLRQALSNTNTQLNTSQIETILNQTGKQIYSSLRSRNFSRIDVHSALLNISTNISFYEPTPQDAQNSTNAWFVINVTTNTPALSLLQITIYNSSQALVWVQNTTAPKLTYNYSALIDDTYTFNATANNSVNTRIATEARTITIDTTRPLIQYESTTTGDNVTTTNTTFTINVTATDSHLRTINISIYNSSHALIWRENSTNSPLAITFNATSDQTYYYNATATDWFGWTNSTATRNITINANPSALLNYSFKYISNESAVLLTTIDALANATVQFGTDINLTTTYYNQTITQNHEFTLTNLTNNTLYYFNVSFTDSSLNNLTNGTFTFTTQPTYVVLNETEWFTNETTDFSQFNTTQLQNLSNVSFVNNQGIISFIENINITTPLNLTGAIRISQHRIEVNTTLLPQFNKSANLTFRNVTLTHPIVKRNNADCSTTNGNCTNVTYNSSTSLYAVLVSSFSTYELVEQCSDGVQNYGETGTDCGGSNCNACAASSSGGGGGSGRSGGGGGGAGVPMSVKKVNITNSTINTTLPSVNVSSPAVVPTINQTLNQTTPRINQTQNPVYVQDETNPVFLPAIIITLLVGVFIVFGILRK